jgi:hypothetical protein
LAKGHAFICRGRNRLNSWALDAGINPFRVRPA